MKHQPAKNGAKPSANTPPRPPYLIATLIAVGVMGALAVLVLPLLQPAYTPEYTGGARLQVDKEVVDLGQVKYDVPVEAVFTLKNIGDTPLRLVREPVVELREGC
jgi:hypothetical protein